MDRTFIYNRRLSPQKISNYAYGYVWVKNSFEKATEDDDRSGGTRMSYYMDGIRQGGADGVLEFTLQGEGTMTLTMTQYGQIIGKGVRKQ